MKKYSKDHEWVIDIEDGKAEIGISDYAQDSLGDIVYVNLHEVGDAVEADSVSDLVSPVTGEVLEVNEDILDAPETLNQSAEDTWLIRVTVTSKLEDLMDADEYREYIKTLYHSCSPACTYCMNGIQLACSLL